MATTTSYNCACTCLPRAITATASALEIDVAALDVIAPDEQRRRSVRMVCGRCRLPPSSFLRHSSWSTSEAEAGVGGSGSIC